MGKGNILLSFLKRHEQGKENVVIFDVLIFVVKMFCLFDGSTIGLPSQTYICNEPDSIVQIRLADCPDRHTLAIRQIDLSRCDWWTAHRDM
jgi:hypothetical protein